MTEIISQREREREGKTDRQTDRQTDRERESLRQRKIMRDRKTEMAKIEAIDFERR